MRPGIKVGRTLVRRKTYGKLLAPLLILVLLICHGLVGATHHATSGAGVGEAASTSGSIHAGMEDHPFFAHVGAGEGSWTDALGYAAALMFPVPLVDHAADEDAAADGGSGLAGHAGALIFAAAIVLWSLLKGMPVWRRAPLSGLVFRGSRLTSQLPSPPAPAAPTLQVFRL